MSETTARLRWKHEPEASRAALAGYAGTFSQDLFRIYAPDESDDRWILASLLPGADHRSGYGASAEELKPVAERLLEEFVTSLGAAFPAEADDDLFDDEDADGEPLEVKYAAGRRVRYAHPGAGYPGEAEHAAASLVIGEVYTIGWADIGQSRTNLNLYRGGEAIGSFNSVFFDLADDEPEAKTATAGEEQ